MTRDNDIEALREVLGELVELVQEFDSEAIAAFEYDNGYYDCKSEYDIPADAYDRDKLAEYKDMLTTYHMDNDRR